MKNIIIPIIFLITVLTGCQKFLEQTPNGTLSEEQLNTPQAIENMCISAYSGVGNDEINRPMSLWGYGNVRADDAYKGGGGLEDNTELHWMEISSPSLANEIGLPDVFWYRNYIVVSRINSALRALHSISEQEMPLKNIRIAEMRFLRAHIHFYNKILFKHIPYITEEMSRDDISNQPNVSDVLTSDSIWQQLADDLEYAYEHLPQMQAQAGRPDRNAAAAYLAKVYLYKAYRQDEMHNVTEINQQDLQKVVFYADEALAGKYGLENDFANNFLPGEYENGKESIWAIQYSQEDGTTWGRLNMGCVLCCPTNGDNMTSPGMDFHKPSQSLVNAFITKDGLPDFENYNKADLVEIADKVDARLYHTVAMPGKPYKYTDKNFTTQCARTPQLYGYYSSLKENIDPASPYYQKAHAAFAWYGNSKNWIVLRAADVMLFKAEALIELHRHNEALPIINQIRQRAAGSLGKITFALSKINVQPYPDGNWTEEYARQALRWERRLELGCEGFRFFDLVRWGIAAEVMNAYYTKEQAAHSYYAGAFFQKNKNEYLPIPIQQLRWSKNVYKQNYGFNN
jgi:hypothetical protein